MREVKRPKFEEQEKPKPHVKKMKKKKLCSKICDLPIKRISEESQDSRFSGKMYGGKTEENK